MPSKVDQTRRPWSVFDPQKSLTKSDAEQIPIRRRGLDESDVTEAVELYEGGSTLIEVGLRFGVSQQAVRRALDVEGVTIRPGGRRARVSA